MCVCVYLCTHFLRESKTDCFRLMGWNSCGALLGSGGLLTNMHLGTSCSVPVNGPKFRIDRLHTAGGICKQRILGLQNYIMLYRFVDL